MYAAMFPREEKKASFAYVTKKNASNGLRNSVDMEDTPD